MTRRALPTTPWEQLPDNYRSILRELGHTRQTYSKVQQADELLRQVNQSMRRRSGAKKYWISSLSGPADIIWKR